jgi:hypothetical protein
MWLKEEKFDYISGNIKRTLGKRVKKDTMLKFYRDMSVLSLLNGRETWVMKETKVDFKQVKRDFLEISKDMEE